MSFTYRWLLPLIELGKELALVGMFAVLTLLLSGVALQLSPPSSAVYVRNGVGWIVGISILMGMIRLAMSPPAHYRPVLANIVAATAVAGTFFVLVPVTIERSVSVFLLETMAQEEKSYSGEELDGRLLERYLCQHAAVDKRMREQLQIGQVEILPDGSYRLTPRGRAVAKGLAPLGHFFAMPRAQGAQQCRERYDDRPAL